MKQTSVSLSSPAILTDVFNLSSSSCMMTSLLMLSPEIPPRSEGSGGPVLGFTGSTVLEIVVESDLLYPLAPRGLCLPPLLPLEITCWFASVCLSWRCPPPLVLTLDARGACGGVIEFNSGCASAIRRLGYGISMLYESLNALGRLEAEEEVLRRLLCSGGVYSWICLVGMF